jgi:hypothetical protein
MKAFPSLAVFAIMGSFLRVSSQNSTASPLNTTEIHLNITGHYGNDTVYTFQPVPFEVPVGCTSIHVLQKFSDKGPNAIDLGVWNPRGTAIYDGRNQSYGFSGWSGGAKTNFTISPKNASTGYIPQFIEPGTWYVMMAPCKLFIILLIYKSC